MRRGFQKNYSIAGKNVALNLKTGAGQRAVQSLRAELGLYAEASGSATPDVLVNIGRALPDVPTLQVNPSLHREVENGFVAQYKKYAVMLRRQSGQLVFDLALSSPGNPLLAYAKKFNNIQYNSVTERLGHIFFENILVPAIYFETRQFLVHAAALVGPTNEAVLIGGTGGVGKTSLEIHLCRRGNFSFLADDMAIIDETGLVHPNLAFPKIYGYNLRNNSELRRLILGSRSPADKLAWHFRNAAFGPSGVRRKISPAEVYGRYATGPARLRHYLILLRETRSHIEMQDISAETAAEMSLRVLQSELGGFNIHLLWHEYNCLAAGRAPILSLQSTLDRWHRLLHSVLEDVHCRVLRIPLDIEHGDFVSRVSEVVHELY